MPGSDLAPWPSISGAASASASTASVNGCDDWNHVCCSFFMYINFPISAKDFSHCHDFRQRPARWSSIPGSRTLIVSSKQHFI